MRKINQLLRVGRGGLMLLCQRQPWDHRFSFPGRRESVRFLDIYQLASKTSIEKERARLADEMNRGYFADMKELELHGGKIAKANATLVPEISAVKFPDFEANFSDGKTVKLPIGSGSDAVAAASDCPKASLLCLSFRAYSQPMVESWSVPFLNMFHNSGELQIYEVSFIDSKLLRMNPIKKFLLWMMKRPMKQENYVLERKTVYCFDDHYYFRKELRVINLLTGYIYLLDKFGRIRWQGFGMASEEELSSLFSCTSSLLQEK